MGIRDVEIDFDIVRGDLLAICSVYWADWHLQNSHALYEAKEVANKVRIATKRLIDTLDSTDAFVNDALVAMSPTWASSLDERFAQLEALEDACSEILRERTPRGAKPSISSLDAVRQVANVWRQISGRNVSRNFKRSGRGNNEFEAESSRFIHQVMVCIDPSLSFSRLQTTLRHFLERDR